MAGVYTNWMFIQWSARFPNFYQFKHSGQLEWISRASYNIFGFPLNRRKNNSFMPLFYTEMLIVSRPEEVRHPTDMGPCSHFDLILYSWHYPFNVSSFFSSTILSVTLFLSVSLY